MWLLSGFGVVGIGLRDQGADEGAEQGLAATAGVVDELEEAEIDGQLLPRDATVWPEPGAQQRKRRPHLAITHIFPCHINGLLAILEVVSFWAEPFEGLRFV